MSAEYRCYIILLAVLVWLLKLGLLKYSQYNTVQGNYHVFSLILSTPLSFLHFIPIFWGSYFPVNALFKDSRKGKPGTGIPRCGTLDNNRFCHGISVECYSFNIFIGLLQVHSSCQKIRLSLLPWNQSIILYDSKIHIITLACVVFLPAFLKNSKCTFP